MAALERRIGRLGARRQRHIISGTRPLLSQQQFRSDELAPVFAAAAAAFVAALSIDVFFGTLRQLPTLLSLHDLVGIGALGGLAMGVWRGVKQRALLSAQPEPRQLAAAVKQELTVSEERRAEVERISLSGVAAYWLTSEGSLPRLLIETSTDWVLFQPPTTTEGSDVTASVHRRWLIERLRWTHAILSVSGHGPQLEATHLPLPAGTLSKVAACEIQPRSELPAAIQSLLPSAMTGYRR
ncbi:MAG: hypothetical protein JKY37_03035 [Nannocystaceae bacterium]|nr:hypothetical protein [Nannocystaceae bacterium]